MTAVCSAQGLPEEVFDGLQPGLIATFRDDAGEQSRIDPDVAAVWGASAPMRGLSPAAFSASWSGVLFLKQDTTYHFHVYLQGKVSVTVDGRAVVAGERAEPGWITGPATELEFGFLPLEVQFEKTAPESVIKLYWSSEAFPIEPLPHHLLLHEEDDAAIKLVERGRVLFDAHRCNRCHRSSTERLAEEAPPFIAVAADLNPDWLVSKLEHKHPEAAHSLMPTFGFNQEQAAAVGAWMWHINQPPRIVPLRKPVPEKKQSLPDGHSLIHTVGCLACHQLGEHGTSGPYGGGDLSRIGAKRTGDWLYTWLGQPDRINPERRMPLIKLTPTERSQIATALAELGRSPEMTFERPQYDGNTQLVQQGRDLVRQARCFNCHKTPAMEADVRGLPTLDQPIQDWTRSCLSEVADLQTGRPAYPQADRDALQAYVSLLATIRQRERQLSPAANGAAETAFASDLSSFQQGRLLLQRRNCLQCHERDGAHGIVATAGALASADQSLRGLSEALIPPNLTGVGDKLNDAALAEAVGGDQKSIRLPWLQVRMPKFQHSDEERAALAAYLIGHDRIPAQPPASRFEPHEFATSAPEETTEDSAELLLGRQLVGVGGFSCIACHIVGEYEPRNTALGTRGSDLKGLANRMRPEYFHRWTRSPLRIVPGMEMPSYADRPAPGVLDGHVDLQLAALWRSLNHPRFEAPTNPSQVEQLLTVQPGEPVRILRDVFTVSKENGGGYVSRALAMGFPNGHSILFDLDRAGVRDWTYGDFARQRTEGKSWYWDLAGAPVVSGLAARSEFVLRDGDQWIALGPEDGSPFVELLAYSANGREVHFLYRLQIPGRPEARVEIREQWSSCDEGSRVRLRRRIEAASGGAELWLVPGLMESLLLNAGLDRDENWQDCGEFGKGLRLVEAATIEYLADAAPLPGPAPPRPELPRNEAPVTTAPGFVGTRLPIPSALMPTSLAFALDGTLGVTSLKGQLVVLQDADGDGLPETAVSFEEGLSAPFGLISGEVSPGADRPDAPTQTAWLVVHKPELLAVVDRDGDGRADERQVVASGWGLTDNYHDWSAGPVRDADGNLYVATSSDYAQPGRPEALSQWRGKVLKVRPNGEVTSIASELRYPMGIAFDSRGRLFVSDQQGVANCFNEIDHIVEGARYGVKGLYDPDTDQPEKRAAIQIPHPWTRSVNGIFFVPDKFEGDTGHPLAPFAGHGLGCEYNSRFLIRFSLQEVEGDLQGATYLFTRNTFENEAEAFLGPICGAVAENGDIYVGSIHDSGWLGGMNTGEIVRLRPTGQFPNGIREIRAIPNGFEIEFLAPVDPQAARKTSSYSLSGYTRVWKGSYATEDSGQYVPKIESIDLSADGRTVQLHVDRLEPAYVYDVAVQSISADGKELFPNIGYYTMNKVPQRSQR